MFNTTWNTKGLHPAPVIRGQILNRSNIMKLHWSPGSCADLHSQTWLYIYIPYVVFKQSENTWVSSVNFSMELHSNEHGFWSAWNALVRSQKTISKIHIVICSTANDQVVPFLSKMPGKECHGSLFLWNCISSWFIIADWSHELTFQRSTWEFIYIRANYINRSCNDSSVHIAKNPLSSHLHGEISAPCGFPQLTLLEDHTSSLSRENKFTVLSETKGTHLWLCCKGHCKL